MVDSFNWGAQMTGVLRKSRPHKKWGPCQNVPPCPHPAVLHEMYERDPHPRCAMDGCQCGAAQQGETAWWPTFF